jgi:hypothetical protein
VSLINASPRDYEPRMLTKPLLFAVLATCGIPSTAATTEQPEPPAEQPDVPPAPPPQEGETYWCCDSVNGQGNGSGEGCEEILHSVVALCNNVLHCTKGYTKNADSKVTCTDG